MNDFDQHTLMKFANYCYRRRQTFQAKCLPIQKSLRDDHTFLVNVIFRVFLIIFF